MAEETKEQVIERLERGLTRLGNEPACALEDAYDAGAASKEAECARLRRLLQSVLDTCFVIHGRVPYFRTHHGVMMEMGEGKRNAVSRAQAALAPQPTGEKP